MFRSRFRRVRRLRRGRGLVHVPRRFSAFFPRGITFLSGDRSSVYVRMTRVPVTVATDASGVFGPSLVAWQLTQNEGYVAMTEMWDEYRIEKAVLKLVPQQTDQNASVPVGGVRGRCYSILNPFGQSAGSMTIDSVRVDSSLKTTDGFRVHTRVVRPNLLSEVFLSAITTDYARSKARWLSTAIAGATHYGLAIAGEGFSGTTNVYHQYVYVYVRFRKLTPSL